MLHKTAAHTETTFVHGLGCRAVFVRRRLVFPGKGKRGERSTRRAQRNRRGYGFSRGVLLVGFVASAAVFCGFLAVTQQSAASTQRFDFPSKVGFFGIFPNFSKYRDFSASAEVLYRNFSRFAPYTVV